MSNYKGILTNKGKELLANAAMGNRVNFSHLALGDGNGSTPTLNETRTALVKERHRLTLNSVDINPNNRNQIICEVIIPTNIGGFTVRELGLFAGNFLVMHSTYPPTYKPRQDEGGAREMVIRVVINVQNADVVALYLDTSLVYATRGWVETNFINHNEVIDNLTSTDTNKPLSALQGKILKDSLNFVDVSLRQELVAKVNKSGDTMTGHLRVSYANDWVGFAANNPTEGKNIYFDAQVNNVARGGLQLVSLGNGRYDAIIGITPTGATTSDRRVGGLTISQDGLHAHAYGHLHEYFVKTRDDQIINGLKSFSSSITVGSHNNWGRVTFPLPDNTNWVIETNPQYKSLGVGQPAFRFNHNDGGNRIFYDLVKSNKSENIAYQSWVSDHFVAHDEVVNNLTSADINKPLSAAQGKKLNDDKLDKAGGVLTGGLYLHPNGLRSSGDTDTGIDFPRDGVMRMIADGRERIHIAHGGTSLRTQDGVSLTLQNDKNLVVYDEQNRPIFASNTVLLDLADKVNKSGDTMTGHLAVTYNSDWVGMAVKNPNNQRNGFYDVNIGGVTRGSFQIVHGGNNAYNAIINITSQGDNAERRVAGLTVSATGLHAHAYGHLHEYFVKARDNQTIDGNKTFSQEVVTTKANGFRIKNSAKNRSIFWRFDGDILYLLKTPNGDPNGNWDDARPLEWNVNTNQLVVRGNADTTTRLQTARNIALTGAVTGNVNFDGSGNVIIPTTLTKAVVREYNRTINGTATGQTTNTMQMVGQVVVGADGRITQYFHLKHFRDFWFLREDNAVGYQNNDGTSFVIPIVLWTAMPNKILSVTAQTMRSTNPTSSAQYQSEAAEHVLSWDKRKTGNATNQFFINISRFRGGSSEHIDLFLTVEGY